MYNSSYAQFPNKNPNFSPINCKSVKESSKLPKKNYRIRKTFFEVRLKAHGRLDDQMLLKPRGDSERDGVKGVPFYGDARRRGDDNGTI